MAQEAAVTVPPLRHHKAKGSAYIRLDGRFVYFGKWGTPEAHQRYARFVAEFHANGGTIAPPQHVCTVTEVCARYWQEAQTHYRHADGTTTGSLNELRLSLKPLRALYGDTPAKDLGPAAVKTVRAQWLKDGLSRTSINKRVGFLKRAVRWAAENELIPAATWHAVVCVSNLKRGRTEAPEPRKVLPVLSSHVEAVKPHLPAVVVAMIELQLCTGARPAEIAGLRAIDIDVSGPVWIAKIERHKTAYTGAERKIYIGPKGQAILKPFMASKPLHEPLFDPRDAESERHAKAEGHRRPDQKPNPRKTDRKVRDSYDTHSYRHAITRACDKAKIPHWSPNQLRHSFATTVRKAHGLDTAQTLLGHADADITQVYALADEEKALAIMAQIG